MSNSPIQRVVVIPNEQGLHARPADRFVRLAQKFESKIEILRGSDRVQAKSIMDLLTLGATKGTQLTLEADGSDAEQALEALVQLVEHGFQDEDDEENKVAS